MKKCLSKTIALLLCAVMLLGAGCGTVASAAQTEPAPKQAMEMHRDKDGNTWATPKPVEAEEETAPAKQPVRKSEPVKAEPAVKTETKKVNTSAKKAQTVTSVIRQPAKQAIRQEGEEFFGFETFEDLKQIAAMDLPEHASLCFEGTEPLVIAESMTFPKPVNLDWAGADVVVPAGVTLRADAEGSVMWTKSLTVAGTVKGFQVGANAKLDITGGVAVSATMDIGFDTVVSGLENVTYTEEWAVLRYTVWLESEDWTKDLDAALAAIKKANSVGDNAMVEVRWDTNGDIVLTESVTIPENCSFYVDRLNNSKNLSLSVAQGATLTVLNNFCVEGALYINGTLVNEGWMGTDDWKNGSQIVFADGSSYEGEGGFYAYGTADDPAQVFVGLDLSRFHVYGDSSDGMHYFELYPYFNGYTFSNFEELKEMTADTENDYDMLRYAGTEPLVIEEDIDLGYVTANFESAKLIVPKGVSITGGYYFEVSDLLVEGSISSICFSVLDGKAEINGTLNVDDFISVGENSELCIAGNVDCGWIDVQGKLKVSGTLKTYENVRINPNAEIDGRENIIFGWDWCGFEYILSTGSIDELKLFFKKAEQSNDPQELFHVDFDLEKDLILEESLVIPENCEWSFSNFDEENTYAFTVGKDVTLTINGNLYLHIAFCVRGTLENNGYLSVSGTECGKLIMEDGATYTGRGNLEVRTEKDSLDSVITGFNMDDFQISKEEDYDSYYWHLTNIAGLTKLGTPTELKWGYTTQWHWDEETDTGYTTLVKGLPGDVAWKNATPTQSKILVEYFKAQESGDESVSSVWISRETLDVAEYDSVGHLIVEDIESGDYYFTVTNKGDGTKYADSDPAVSDIWTYVRPTAKMGNCTKPVIDWPKATWTGPEGEQRYLTEWLYAANEDEEPYVFLTSWGYDSPEEVLWDELIKEHGIGYYSVRARVLSPNIEEACHGDWSEMSDPYFLSELAPEVSDTLDEILGNDTLSTEEKVGAVQDMDNAELKSAMIKDDNVVDMIAQLEEEAGGAAVVEVTDSAKDFDQSKVSVVGANLNNAANAAEDIKLVVDKPEKNHVIPEVFHNSVAVSFSMNLENVKDPHDLEVPVEITLPIPATLNPEFLVILHYDVDGNYEQIEPHISYRGNQYYASFVVSGFSDFMMLSQDNGLKGDMNGDGSVNDDDVILLLWHTLLPELYPVEGEADFTADGNVNDEDVIYLLWHTLIPELYPL